MDQLAKTIWEYHKMRMPLQKADLIITLCSIDPTVAERTAELYLQDYAPYVIFSGGIAHEGDLLNTGWNKPEAEVFSDIAIKKGVPESVIYKDIRAQNTGQNIEYSYEIIKENDLPHEKIILVQKPYMERRTYATFVKQWPGEDVEFFLTSPQMSFEEYLHKNNNLEQLLNLMVGDLQRIKIYPSKGFQIEQDIPDSVWYAYEQLVEMGYDKHLIKD